MQDLADTCVFVAGCLGWGSYVVMELMGWMPL